MLFHVFLSDFPPCRSRLFQTARALAVLALPASFRPPAPHACKVHASGIALSIIVVRAVLPRLFPPCGRGITSRLLRDTRGKRATCGSRVVPASITCYTPPLTRARALPRHNFTPSAGDAHLPTHSTVNTSKARDKHETSEAPATTTTTRHTNTHNEHTRHR